MDDFWSPKKSQVRPLIPCAARCCRKARKGAMPVPGPHMMTGTLGSSGRRKWLSCIWAGSRAAEAGRARSLSPGGACAPPSASTSVPSGDGRARKPRCEEATPCRTRPRRSVLTTLTHSSTRPGTASGEEAME